MSPESSPDSGNTPVPGWFQATHWSVVLTAKDQASPKATAALEQLCQTYRPPICAYVAKRWNKIPQDAEDLTQEFFYSLLKTESLRSVDRSKGKFRNFLLAALDNFLANDWRRNHAQKRGGDFVFVSLDDESKELFYEQVAASTLTPEEIYDQQCAIALLKQAEEKLRHENSAKGKHAQFEELKAFLNGEKQDCTYAALAAKLETTEGALKMVVKRMRERFWELFRKEIENTVGDPADVEEELRAMIAALSR